MKILEIETVVLKKLIDDDLGKNFGNPLNKNTVLVLNASSVIFFKLLLLIINSRDIF